MRYKTQLINRGRSSGFWRRVLQSRVFGDALESFAVGLKSVGERLLKLAGFLLPHLFLLFDFMDLLPELNDRVLKS